MRDLLDACPSCGGRWTEVDPSTRKKYWPMIAGNVVNDRVASWHCLHCSASWERGDASILQPATEARP